MKGIVPQSNIEIERILDDFRRRGIGEERRRSSSHTDAESKIQEERKRVKLTPDKSTTGSIQWEELEDWMRVLGISSDKVEGREEEVGNVERSKRSLTGGGETMKKNPFGKTIFSGVSEEKERQLNDLAEKDLLAAVLEFIEYADTEQSTMTTEAKSSRSSLRLNLDIESLLTPGEVFRQQTIKAIQTANTLNNVLRTPPADTDPLPDRFFFALVEGIVQSDRLVHGAALAFDPGQMPNPHRPIAPYIYRGTDPEYLQVRNITRESRSRYAVNGTEGYEWFWKQRKDYSSVLWKHRYVCEKVNDPGHGGWGAVAALSTAVVRSTAAEGLWGNVQFDGMRGKTWTVAYSVPFFGCNSQKLPVFK